MEREAEEERLAQEHREREAEEERLAQEQKEREEEERLAQEQREREAEEEKGEESNEQNSNRSDEEMKQENDEESERFVEDEEELGNLFMCLITFRIILCKEMPPEGGSRLTSVTYSNSSCLGCKILVKYIMTNEGVKHSPKEAKFMVGK